MEVFGNHRTSANHGGSWRTTRNRKNIFQKYFLFGEIGKAWKSLEISKGIGSKKPVREMKGQWIARGAAQVTVVYYIL